MGVLDCIYNVFANANITKLKDVVTFLCELIFYDKPIMDKFPITSVALLGMSTGIT